MGTKRIELEQDIVCQVNKIIYKKRSLSFHLEFKNDKNVYVEWETKLELSPEELDLLCNEIIASNLRHMKPIRFFVEGEPLAMVVLI